MLLVMLDEDKLMLWHLIHHHLSHDCTSVHILTLLGQSGKGKKNAIKVYDKNRSAVIFLYYMILDKCPQILYDHHITHKCFGFAEY